jgi:hypothetical protein
MMVKRTLMVLGLGVAVLGGGAATAAHASSHVTARPAIIADLVVGDTGAQTAEQTDGATDPAGGPNDQSGAQSGSQDTSGADAVVASAGGDGEAATPETDTAQVGPQDGAQVGQ